MYETRAEPGPSWWDEDGYRLRNWFWSVQNTSELADYPDHYVKWQGQGIYFVRSANWLSLPLCTWLAPSLPFEKCAGQKLVNVLYNPLSNPPPPREQWQGPYTSCFPVLIVCSIFRASLFFLSVPLVNLYRAMGVRSEVHFGEQKCGCSLILFASQSHSWDTPNWIGHL